MTLTEAREIELKGPGLILKNEVLSISELLERTVKFHAEFGRSKGFIEGYKAALESDAVKGLVKALRDCQQEGTLLSFTNDEVETAIHRLMEAQK